MNAVFEYIVSRLSEPSTWRGIIWIVTACGFVLEPEQKEAIATAGMALVGAISIFIEKDKKPAPTQEQVQEVVQKQQNKVKKAVTKLKEKQNESSDIKSDNDNFFAD
jgi:hypothetical protein